MEGFERLLGFQCFWAHRQMSLHGRFILHSDVLTTWPYTENANPSDPMLQGIGATYTICCLSQHTRTSTHWAAISQNRSKSANRALDTKQTCDWRVTGLLWMRLKSPESLGQSVWDEWQPPSSTSTMVIVVNKVLKPQLPRWDWSVVSSRRLWLYCVAPRNELKQRGCMHSQLSLTK